MIIIVGLGNPGRRFKNTPHNLGFAVVDRFRKENRFPRFTHQGKSLVSRGRFGDQEILLVKPLTFMNESGRAVAALAEADRVPSRQIWLVHDDADLDLGQIKESEGRGAGGHKGVASIIETLQTRDFPRFRLGAASAGREDLKDFVLRPYGREERRLAREMAKRAAARIQERLIQQEKAG